MGIVTTLPPGTFFGANESHREIPGFSLARMKPVLPPEDVPLHAHQDATFVLLLNGRYISGASDAAECEAPLLIYNPPGTTHRDRFKTLAGQFLAISVSPESLRHAAEYAKLPDLAVAFRSHDVLATAQMLARELDRWEPTSPLLAEGACLELLARIARTRPDPGCKAPAWIARAVEFLHDRCASPVRILDAAHAIGVHPVHFARSFRKFLRCTPSEYLTRCRLDKAARLLRESELPLADAAVQAGFFDQSHFSKMFKRSFGLPPGSYRRIFRRNRAQVLPFRSIGTRGDRRAREILSKGDLADERRNTS